MKNVIILAVAATLFVECNNKPQVPENAVRELCESMVQVYPQATLQDVYKTCYQDFFGPGHMVTDSVSALEYIRYEVEELKANEQAANGEKIKDEPTGFRHRFVRVDLQRVALGELSEEELLRRFMETANSATPIHDNWAGEWSEIERIALQVHPAWQNEELQKELRKAAENNQAVRHSEPFRETYKPHYRIIRL